MEELKSKNVVHYLGQSFDGIRDTLPIGTSERFDHLIVKRICLILRGELYLRQATFYFQW